MARTIASSVRRLPPHRAALLVALFSTLCLRSARADGENSERAQRLFDDARALMKVGNYSEACPKFAESQRLDPGGGTILNLGLCLQQQGRNAEAWAILNQALAQARSDGRADRERTAQKQLAALSVVLSRLILHVSPSASAEPVTVTIDGLPLSAEQLASPLPLDPGTHEVRASAAHHQSWGVQITVAPSASEQQLTIPALQPEIEATPEPAPRPNVAAASLVAPPIAATAPSRAEDPRPSRSDNARRPELYAAFGVGAVALGLGSYFGARSLALKNESNRHWDGQHCTQPSCVEAWNEAQTAARACDVSIGVGLLALGVGTYFLLRPSQRETAPASTRFQLRASQAGAFVSTSTDF